jgi:hypothetical protein
MSGPTKQHLRIIILIALACFSGATTEPAEHQTPAEFIADSWKILQPWQKLPLLPARKISDVVRFSEEQGLLVADWPMLRNGPVTGRIPISDLPGVAKIQCLSSLKFPQALSPMFEYYDLTQPDFVCRHLQVLNMADRLTVVQDSESIDRYESVSLLEIIGQTDDAPITLRVQIMQDGKPSVNLVFSAATLGILRHEHPTEFEHFLRPMFRDFHQERTVFWMDDRIDWQVLADEWHAPPDLAERVWKVLDQLKAGDFAQRQQAQKALHDLGEPAALFLHASNRDQWTPEQTARIDQFLQEYFILGDQQATKLGSDVNFLLDCLTSDDADLRAAALARLDRVLGRKIDFTLDQSPADRNLAVEKLRRQLAPSSENSGEAK